VLGQLDERQQRVVQSFYGIGEEPQTMAEIAQKMGVKRERVRQIRKKAVRHILKITGNTELKHYLKA
jgi:RNA polymerase sigma factor rpoD